MLFILLKEVFMQKNPYTSLFHSVKAFREYKWPLLLGCPIIVLFLLVYLVNSLAETPQHLEKDENALLPSSVHNNKVFSYHSGEVSAKELVPLGLAPAEKSSWAATEIAAKKSVKKSSTYASRKKSSRSASMTKVRPGMTFIANASGYTGPGGTKSGTSVRKGIVAVDPNYIPLGTVLRVEGYGECRAEDTGSAIKGNAIDLAFSSESEALRWGRKDVQVTVISVPE
jgi:3D (Asp-Asp-Asp) domain-containing protein